MASCSQATRSELFTLAQQIRFRLMDATENAAASADDRPWHQRMRAEVDKVASWLATEHGAKLTAQGDCTFVLIHHQLATSTGGTIAALRNWCTAAERRARAA